MQLIGIHTCAFCGNEFVPTITLLEVTPYQEPACHTCVSAELTKLELNPQSKKGGRTQ